MHSPFCSFRQSFLPAALVGLCALLVACGSLPGGTVRDGGPTRQVNVHTIPELVPRHEPVLRAGNYSPYTVMGQTYEVMSTSRGYREQGYASWYGSKFHGRLTSNGEIYDMYKFTAAHKTLPIPAYVLVRNLDNGRELVVRVNDRGPFHDDRIIDLSWAAAERLGFADLGVARVEVIALDPSTYQTTLAEAARDPVPEVAREPVAESLSPPDSSFLQIAALSTAEAAFDLAEDIALISNMPVEILMPGAGEQYYRVQAGPIEQPGQLDLLRTLLSLNGLSAGYLVSREQAHPEGVNILTVPRAN